MRTRQRDVRYVRSNAIEPVKTPNERGSLDFMHARLMHGRTYRLLNVVDDFTGETLAIERAFLFGSAEVLRGLENIAYERNLPKTLRSDNGSEFCSDRAGAPTAILDGNLSDPASPRRMPRSNRSTGAAAKNC
jgi:transposase InsO family protein